MSDDDDVDSDNATSLFGLSRTQLTAIGVILILVGAVILLGALSQVATPPSNPFDFAAAQARQAQIASAGVTAFVGVILLGIGIGALRFGLVRPVASYLVSEASPAIERATEAAAEGWRQGSGGSAPQDKPVVKIKCRYCGYLENEDAEYCGKCGKPL